MADTLYQELKTGGLLNGKIFAFYEETESTNIIALQKAKQNAPAGTIIVAASQSGGRGRLGRKWISPSGTGLYFSIILRPDLSMGDIPKITLAAGVSVCLAIEETTGLAPQIKWPNDILINRKKIGGILCESTQLLGDGSAVVVGIGINVNMIDPKFVAQELRLKITSIEEETGRKYLRSKILTAIVEKLETWVGSLEAGRFSEILGEIKERDALAGQKLSWVTPAGEVVEGVSEGIGQDGFLKVRDDEGTVHEVISGDINLVSK